MHPISEATDVTDGLCLKRSAGTLLNSMELDTNNSGMTYDSTLNRYWDLDVNGRLSYFDPANGYNQTQVATIEQFPGFPGSFDGLAFVTRFPNRPPRCCF